MAVLERRVIFSSPRPAGWDVPCTLVGSSAQLAKVTTRAQ